MGCSNSSPDMVVEFDDYKENKRLKLLIINYILLRKEIFYNDKISDENIYLVETDYFQKICEKINFNFNENKIVYNEYINRKLLSDVFNLGNSKIKFIEKKYDIKSKDSIIEIITEKILNKLNFEEEEYEGKNITYNKISEEEIEIIFRDNSKLKLNIMKEKIPFKIITEEKNKPLNKTHLRKDLDESGLNKIKYNKIKENEFSKDKFNISEDQNILANTNFTVVENNKNKNILNSNSEHNILNTMVANNKEIRQTINFRMFYECYRKFFDDLNNMNNLISKPIDSNKVYNDYAILSKRSYNLLIKLFESDSKYFNENFIIDSFEKLKPNYNIDFNNLNIKNRWKEYIKTKSFFNLDMEKIKDTESKYPINFILIKRNLLEKFGFDYNEFKSNSFDVFFGEDHLFIKISKKNRVEIIICSKDKFFFNTNIVLFSFQKKYFKNEVEPNIKNKGGFNDFFSKIGFDTSNQSIYRHIIGEDIISEIYIINYKYNKKQIKVNPFLKQIIISLYNIKELKEYFGKYASENKDLISLFIQFIHQFPFKYENGLIIINEIEDIIKLNGIENNFNNIINFIIEFMHLSLNKIIFGYKNKNENEIYGAESTDKNYVLDICINKFNHDNKTIIKDLFYGIILNTTTPTCCSERYYKCAITKYIYLNYEDIKNHDDLGDIMENWAISKDDNYHCEGCFIESDADINKTYEVYPKILIIILNDEKEKNKKSIKFPIELNISNFSFNYKLLSVISSKTFDNNFKLFKYENENWLLAEKIEKKIGQKEVENYSKYPRVFFYERNKQMKFKERSGTEIGFDNFFNQTPSSKNLKIDNTRIKNSLDYHNEDSFINNNISNENELFKKNNYNINQNEPDLNQNKYPNNNFSINNNENQNLIQLNNIDNIPLPKEYIDALGGINNLNIIINNKSNSNNNSEYYDDDFGKKDGNKDEIKKLQYNLNFNKYNITNNIQINQNNTNNQTNNNSNNNFNNETNFNKQNNNPFYNKINQYNKYYPMNNNNLNDEKFLNPKFSYVSSDKQSNILEKKEINLKFVYNGFEFSLALYDENIAFIDVIQMLKDQIPEIQSENYYFVTQGEIINITKTIKENKIKDGFVIIMFKSDSNSDK